MTEETDLTSYVVTRLGRAANHDDLVMEVCRRTGMDWDAAEGWIARVAQDHSVEVARRQTPTILILCVGAILGGLGLAGSAFFAMAEPVLAVWRGAHPAAALFGYTAGLWYYLPQFIGGAGLAGGGAVGLLRLWQKLRGIESD